jgi:hypothetical protein
MIVNIYNHKMKPLIQPTPNIFSKSLEDVWSDLEKMLGVT